MTNYIEKLYELAKVEKRQLSGIIKGDYPMRFHDVGYPPFTPEKQLELIKKLARIQPIKITDTSENWYVEPSGYYQMTPSKDFPQALAGLVCGLWKDLTPEQREEIKRILE